VRQYTDAELYSCVQKATVKLLFVTPATLKLQSLYVFMVPSVHYMPSASSLA